MIKNIKFPYEISLEITSRCNLKCLHCYNDSGNNVNRDLSDEILMDLCNDIVDLNPRNVCFTGGEPLMRKEVLIKMISIISKKNITTSIATNGMLLDYKFAKELKRAGLSHIQISFDGLKDSHNYLRNNPLSFDLAIKALEHAKYFNIDTHVAFVPTNKNFNELEELISLLRKHQIKTFRSQRFMQIGRGDSNFIVIPNKEEYLYFINSFNILKSREILYSESISYDWSDPMNYIENIVENSNHVFSIHIRSNGNVCYTPLLPLTIGNINASNLKKILSNRFLGKEVETLALRGVNNLKYCDYSDCFEKNLITQLNSDYYIGVEND